MDIGISSNFERYLFELLGHDPEHLDLLMSEFSSSGKFTVSADLLNKARQDFSAYRISDAQTASDIRNTYQLTGEIIDPHSIIGVSAARQEGDSDTPIVVLGTAHPAKFPDAIRNALGIETPLPAQAGDLFNSEEHYSEMANDPDSLKNLIRAG
jgi:threonine synthase